MGYQLYANSQISQFLVDAIPLLFICTGVVVLAVPLAIILNTCVQWLMDNVWNDISK